MRSWTPSCRLMKIAVGSATTRDRRKPYADAVRRRSSSTFAVCSPQARYACPRRNRNSSKARGSVVGASASMSPRPELWVRGVAQPVVFGLAGNCIRRSPGSPSRAWCSACVEMPGRWDRRPAGLEAKDRRDAGPTRHLEGGGLRAALRLVRLFTRDLAGLVIRQPEAGDERQQGQARQTEEADLQPPDARLRVDAQRLVQLLRRGTYASQPLSELGVAHEVQVGQIHFILQLGGDHG